LLIKLFSEKSSCITGKEIEGNIEFLNPENAPPTRINLIKITITNNENVVLRAGTMTTVWI